LSNSSKIYKIIQSYINIKSVIILEFIKKFLLFIINNFIVFIFFIARFIEKKFFYTINHKKLGLFYFFFSLITAIAGSYLASCIRFEMSYSGSPFFDGDSLKYLQVISAHALIMIFFVVVPIFYGGFANYLLPYHVGSKDVAFPRLNNLGF
jgi:heme/copper-type cytochrome/quinol oxidase subunit 1